MEREARSSGAERTIDLASVMLATQQGQVGHEARAIPTRGSKPNTKHGHVFTVRIVVLLPFDWLLAGRMEMSIAKNRITPQPELIPN